VNGGIVSSDETVAEVAALVVSILGLESRAASIDASTLLLGHLPELDSMSVIEILTELEARFDIRIEDEEISGELLESIGTLAAFVDAKLVTARA
jgi:acyl carrier protein